MEITESIDVGEETRELILQAAEKRFRKYGYNKTTMAEIADDTGMSAANIYRYFENKQEIIANCARKYFHSRMILLRKAIEKYHSDPVKMLEHFVLATLHYSHKLAIDNKKITELVEYIKEKRPDIIYERIATETGLISEILRNGHESGKFEIDNIDDTARSIYACIFVFDLPIFMNMYPLDEFEDMARSMVRTLVQGLHK